MPVPGLTGTESGELGSWGAAWPSQCRPACPWKRTAVRADKRARCAQPSPERCAPRMGGLPQGSGLPPAVPATTACPWNDSYPVPAVPSTLPAGHPMGAHNLLPVLGVFSGPGHMALPDLGTVGWGFGLLESPGVSGVTMYLWSQPARPLTTGDLWPMPRPLSPPTPHGRVAFGTLPGHSRLHVFESTHACARNKACAFMLLVGHGWLRWSGHPCPSCLCPRVWDPGGAHSLLPHPSGRQHHLSLKGPSAFGPLLSRGEGWRGCGASSLLWPCCSGPPVTA